MPTRSDITVVNSAYDTSGNGGRKLVRLSNGWLVSATYDATGKNINLYKSTDNGGTWTLLCYANSASAFAVGGVSLVAKGTDVHILINHGNGIQVYHNRINALTVTSGTNIFSTVGLVDNGQSTLGSNSLTINDTGTELHAAWASKNASYPNSFNIRYAKGTINADGSVTWSAVQQLSTANTSGYYEQNPTIGIANGKPFIIRETYNGSNYSISCLRFDGSAWVHSAIYFTPTYAQSSPSAIFVPQSINGLVNGRIWVAWHGTDATDTTFQNIRVSYSDDGGVTWSAMTKLTTGNTINSYFASITANKNNEIFVVHMGNTVALGVIKNTSGTWGSSQTIKSGTGTYPSTLYDTTLNFSSPLYIYKDTSKVGFYGTWTITTISVPEGYIGTKTVDNINSLLNYSITSDGTMTTVTEKVNGVSVGSGMLASGEITDVMVNQTQWDAIKFGKYKDTTGGLNTITIEMGSDVWTYTFDKRLSANEDIEKAIKASQDAQGTYLASVKSKVASAITSKGGTATGSDSFDTLVTAISGFSGLKIATGTITSSASGSTFTYLNGVTQGMFTITATGLPFKPIFIYAFRNNGSANTETVTYNELSGDQYPKTVKVAQGFGASSTTLNNYHFKGDVAPVSVVNGSFTLPVYSSNVTNTYIAIGY